VSESRVLLTDVKKFLSQPIWAQFRIRDPLTMCDFREERHKERYGFVSGAN
jgi:hypothetical protein